MENDKTIPFPIEVGYHGGITYRFFPGCVECEITYADESGFIRQKGVVTVPLEHTEHYSITGMAKEALFKARQAKAEGITPELDLETAKKEGRKEALDEVRNHILFIWQMLGLKQVSMR